MKRCIILALLLPVAAVVTAQVPLSMDVQKRLAERQKPSQYFVAGVLAPVKVLPLQDTGKADALRKLLEAQRLQRGGLVTATYSHTTGRGKVYTLAPDNMPCLVPDMKAVAPMPNRGGVIMDDRMNALPRQRIIPPDAKTKERR